MESDNSQNNPTNRELAMIIENNLEKNELQHKMIMESITSFHENMRIQLQQIIEQTTKTNGTVKSLTSDMNNLKSWRTGIAMCIALLAFALTISSSFFSNLIH